MAIFFNVGAFRPMSDRELEKNAVATSSEDPIFDDIRPCRDEEVHQEIAKIYNDQDLIRGLARLSYPRLNNFLGPLIRYRIQSYLKHVVKDIHTVADFQLQVANYFQNMVKNTTDGVVYRGFESLDPNKSYFFISNHRDISLDPAFIDYALHDRDLETVRIAIGDNLLKLPAATALMRLNKSFIVKRSVVSLRDKLLELNHLSEYIGLSLKEGHSIWIAQREGRAKDGNDATESAVLKMIYMYGRKQKLSFADYMKTLNIVPVSINYEYDPSDIDKAHELEERAKNNGQYQKGELEDIKSIIKGIKGYKGRVCISAGKPITEGFDEPEELASLIDQCIYQNYEMFPSVLLSAHKLGYASDREIQDISSQDKIKFENHIASCPEHLRERILNMYAWAYRNQKASLQESAK